MPKFIPKGDRKDEKKSQKPAPEVKKKMQPSDEDLAKLRELEKKFGKTGGAKEPSTASNISETKKPDWKKVERKDEKKSVQSSGATKDLDLINHEAIRRSRIPTDAVSKDDAQYISKDKLERRKRELSMTEARLRSLEREEQEINKRLEYLRREHSAMELAIKEKSHLEREIAELREDRNRVKAKLDEFKSMAGQLEEKTWEELRKSPAIGAKISALERRIHELEGQILELNEQRFKGTGVTDKTTAATVQPQPKPQQVPVVKSETKPEPPPAPTQIPAESPQKPAEPKQQKPPKTPEKKSAVAQQKKKKTRLAF